MGFTIVTAPAPASSVYVCPNCKRDITDERDLLVYDGTDMVCVHCSLIHRCPPDSGDGLMPCCGRSPFEVPQSHRMTLDPALVSCPGS